MRVLLTTDCVGGVWTHSLDLARGLRAAGVGVVLATMGAALSDDQRADAESAGAAALHEGEFALEWMDDPWGSVDAAGEWLLEIAAAESVDIVHSNSYSHGALAWRRPVVVAGHSCVVSWWRAVEGGYPPPSWDEYRRRVAAGLRAADAVVAPTRAMLRELEAAHRIAGGIAIHNGSSVPETCRAKEPFVLAAGRLWDRAKGLELLERAATGLRWPVLAAGEGATEAAGEGASCASATGASPLPSASEQNLRALGHLSARELARLRERASIFAAPARYEPFGLAILEAARAGCALVLSDIASLRELWSEAAAFVPSGDAGALHAQLAALIMDPAERARLARAARLRAQRYSVERMTRGYVRLYERVATPRKEAVA